MTELSSWESIVILEILPSFLLIGILATGSHVLPFLGLPPLSWFDLLKKTKQNKKNIGSMFHQ